MHEPELLSAGAFGHTEVLPRRIRDVDAPETDTGVDRIGEQPADVTTQGDHRPRPAPESDNASCHVHATAPR